MGYIWIISEYAVNKGGIRVEKKHPATQQLFCFVAGVKF
jgi:hypothetical protein